MKFRKIFTAVLAAVMCLTVSSCEISAEPETASKEHVYKEDRVELPDGLDMISNVICTEEKIYLLCCETEFGDNNGLLVSYPFYLIGFDGAVEKKTYLDFDTTNIMTDIKNSCIDDDGSVSIVMQYHGGETNTLYRFSPDGEMLGKSQIDGVSHVIGGSSSEAIDIMPLDGGNYLVLFEQSAAMINSEGKTVKLFKDQTHAEASYTSGLCKTADGRIFMVYTIMNWNDNLYIWEEESELIELDLESGALGERYRISGKAEFLDGTDKYDLLMSRESGLAGYDLETGETEVIIDWIKSGIDRGSIGSDIYAFSDGRIAFRNNAYELKSGGANFSYDNMYVSVLTEIPPEELPDRKLIKLFALNLDDTVRSQILKFNRNNTEYEIELTSFADYEDGLGEMNKAMTAGNIPDVLVLGKDNLGYDILADSYISKGLLADLYDFMDSDPDFDRGDYLENYFKAHEVNGKLYEIAPEFSVSTYAAKTSRVGENEGWTMEEFTALTENMTGKEILGNVTNDWILNDFIFNCGDSYIDRSKGKCYFDSEEFISVLKFCNKFPSEQSEEHYVLDTYSDLRADRQLLDTAVSAGTPNGIRTAENGIFGEQITYKGYPCSVGNGSCFSDTWGIKFAISSKTAVPDGAWGFVKSFLSEEYQQNMYTEARSGSIPIKLTAIEKRFENEQKPWEYTDSLGEVHVEEHNFFGGASQVVDIGYPDEADATRAMELIKSITTVQRRDIYISNIVQEEAGAYFSGQKSAEDVADTIQNRVQNYLDENR